MCRIATVLKLGGVLLITALAASSQTTDWRKIGTGTVARGLASAAGGPVARVWYSPDGSTLFARTSSGSTWQTIDNEKWTAASTAAEPPLNFAARTVGTPLQKGRLYRIDDFVWRSDDGGSSWTNVSAFQGQSILGTSLVDVAVSPQNPDELIAAGAFGVWRSADGGTSWTGLNDGLPNFPLQRILSLGDSGPSIRVLLQDGAEATWKPGQRGQWMMATDSVFSKEVALRASVPGDDVTSATRSGDIIYAGKSDGRLLVSIDRGRTWTDSPPIEGAGRVERIFSDPRDNRFAIAVTSSARTGRVLRTVNGGGFWDDISSDLPAGTVRGVVADRVTGAVYIASAAGVFYTYTDPVAAAPATPWTRLRSEPARDVALDAEGNQLFVGFEALGMWATMSPHRRRQPKVVSAGDRVLRAAAPGAVLSVLGARIDNARAGERPASVLVAGESESQVQLPWDLNGGSVMVSMTSGAGNRIQLGLPLTAASPSIFVDRDGEPLITNADTGLVLDALTPARSSMRLQLLASGLGRVTPAWTAGIPAPLQDPPKVDAPVRAWLDREEVEVTRATLAPGYVGMYLIEIQLPSIVNRGTAELYIEAAGSPSNRVRVWLEP